jgi:hypothetical protein
MTPDDAPGLVSVAGGGPGLVRYWWPLLVLALIVTMRDAAHEARYGPLLAARTEASVEAGLPFWQQQPKTSEEVLAAAEVMLSMDDRSSPLRAAGDL